MKRKLTWILRVEAFAVLALSILAYSYLEASWTLFATLFLIPDIAMIGYLFGKKKGAALYNLSHSLIGPILCLATGLLMERELLLPIGLIWSAHIGFDRTLGYGLKYSTGFHFTHLGEIGKTKTRNSF